MVSATLANAAHKTADASHQVALADHTTLQESFAGNSAASIGMFEGVQTQAIQAQPTAPESSPTQPTAIPEHPSSPATETTSSSQEQGAVGQVQAAATVVSASPAAIISVASAQAAVTSNTASANVAAQQAVTSLNVANAPPAAAANTQTAVNQNVNSTLNTSTASGGSASSSSPVTANVNSPVNLLTKVLDTLNGISAGNTTITLPGATLGGVLSFGQTTVAFTGITLSGTTVTGGTVTVTATSASLTIGTAVTSTIGTITGNYDIGTKTFSLTLNNLSLAISSFVNVSATSASLTYHGAADTAVTLTDGTNTSTQSVSLVTIGISNANIFAGLNGPASNSGAVGVKIEGANLALALMSAADGTTYYGLKTTATTLAAVGLPTGFTMSSTDLSVEVNGGSDGTHVVNFDASFVSGTGLAVSTGSDTVNLDYTQKFLAASGTIELDFNGFVYLHGSMAIQTGTSTSVTLSGGGTKSVTELTIGGDSLTVFAGVKGPSTNTAAKGIELSGASFAIAIFKPTLASDTSVYYGLKATATSLSGVGLPSSLTVGAGDLDVQINGSTDGSNVVNFDTSFVPGTGLAVATGTGTTMNIDFTGSLIRVAGNMTLEVTDFIHISGGFSFTKTADELDIAVGHTAYDGAPDLNFVVGSVANPFFAANGFVSMTITASTFTIGVATLNVTSPLKIASVLEVDNLSVTLSNLAIDLATGSLSGVTDGTGTHPPLLVITAESAAMFPGGSTITGTISATPSGDGLGFQGTFNLQTGAFDITLEQLHLAISSVFTADATGVHVTYDPADADPHQQLVQITSGQLDFKLGQSDLIGNLTSLNIYKDGFSFASVSFTYAGTVKVGSVLSLDSPTVTLTNFAMTFSNGNASLAETGSLTFSVVTGSLAVGSFSVTVKNLTITAGLDPNAASGDPSKLGVVNITADSLNLVFSTYIKVTATGIVINTDPGIGNPYFSVTTATATLTFASTTITGGATDFSVIDTDASGKAAFHAGDNFSVSFGATNDQLKLPTWLGIQIQKFKISWPDFSADPTNFKLVLSASINSIEGLPNDVVVSGEITDAVIDIEKLKNGLFPITSIGSVGGTVSGTLFGLELNAGFVLGVVSFNHENQIVNGDGTVVQLVTDAHGKITETPVTSSPDTAIVNSIMYVGVEGGAKIPGVGGVQVYIGFSSLGPLTLFINAEFPLILDPDTGIAIGGFGGGVIFDYTIPTPSQPTDLASINLSPAGLTASQWQQQLRDQTVTQYTATGGGTNLLAAYTQPFVIEANVTLYDAYLTADAFKITGTIAIQITPLQPNSVSIFVTGTATFGDNLSFNAYMYMNLTVSGGATTATVMFLAEAPADTPVESFGGSLKFGFTDSNGVPITPSAPPTVFSEWIALGTAYNHAGTATISNLAAGTYIWTPGANDISITVGSTTYLASSAVNGQVTITNTGVNNVTFTGTADSTMTGTLGSVLNNGDPLPSGAYYTITTFAPQPPISGFYINLTGFLKYQVPGAGNISVSINGSVTLTVSLSTVNSVTTATIKLDLWGDLNVSFLGEIAVAQGEFVLATNSLGSIQFYGALKVSTGAGLAALSSYGLTVSGALLFQINATGVDQVVNLPNAPPTTAPPSSGSVSPLDSTNSTSFTIQGSVIFDLTILGVNSSAYATLDYAVSGTTIFDLQGYFDLRVTYTAADGLGLQIFADINKLNIGSTGGSSSPSLISFSGFGLFIVNSQGFAAEINLTLSTNNIPDFALAGQFTLVINTTGHEVRYDIPSTTTLPPVNGPPSGADSLDSTSVPGVVVYDVNQQPVNGTAANSTATTIIIPAGPPHGLATLANGIASFPDTGAAGPYVVVAGNGTLTALNTLTMTGTFRFELSYSSTNGLIISAVVNVTANLSGASVGPGGTSLGGGLSVTGAIQITAGGAHQGVVALLSVGGGTTQTTDYGNYAGGSGMELKANFQLGLNTTDQSVSNIGGVDLKDSSGNLITLTSGSFVVIGTGTLAINIGGSGFLISGSIFASGSGTTGVTISVDGTLTASVAGSTLLTMNATGTLVVDATGAIAGQLSLTANGGNPLSGSGFSFSGGFDLELNTTLTNISVPNPLGGPTLTIACAPNNDTNLAHKAAYVEVHAFGNLIFGTSTNGFQIQNTNFYLVLSTNGLAVSASGSLAIVVNGSSLFSISGSVAMLISANGFAASLTLTTTVQDSHGYYAFNGTFNFRVNTTGQDVVIPNGPTISGSPGYAGATAGPYFQLYISGKMALGGTDTSASTGLLLQGDFYLTISSSGLAVTASATLNLVVGGTPIFGLDAKGALLISSSGIAAKITLTLGGSASVSSQNTLFSYSANFLLELNTTGVAITTINNQTVNLPAGVTINNAVSNIYFRIAASGSLTLGGLITLNGSFDFLLTGSSVELSVNATLSVFGITFTASVQGGLYSDGIALSVNLRLGNSLNPTPTVTLIPGVLSLTGTFNLRINTTATSHFGVDPHTTFDVYVNASFNLFGFSLAATTLHIKDVAGVFSATGKVDFDFFGFATLHIGFYFDSQGNYWFHGSAGVRLGSSDFNIHGSLVVEFASNSQLGVTDPYDNVVIRHNFYLYVSGGVTAFGYDFADIAASVSINGSDVSISVYVSIDLGLFSIGGTVTIDLGSIGAAPPAAPPPPALGTLTNGVLRLNLAADAQFRLFQGSAITAQTNETYTILRAPGTTNGLANIWVVAPGLYSGPAEYDGTSTAIPGSPPAGAVEYDGVSSIVVNSTGTSNTTINIGSSVGVAVNITAGSGKNQFITGGGLTTITGTTGNDTVIGGSGGVIFHAGSGTSLFIGGHGNNTIYDPGTVSIVEGYNSVTATYANDANGVPVATYSLTSNNYSYYSLSGSVLTYGDGTTNYTDTLVGTFAKITLTAKSSGAASFAVSNYSGIVVLDANNNSSVTTTITTNGGTLSLTGNVITQSNGLTGSITLQSTVASVNATTGVLSSATFVYNGALNLFGGAGNNTLIVNSWSGTSAINLDGKGGDDNYVVNFQSSGSFTANVHDSVAGGTDVLTVNGTTGSDTINVSGAAVVLGTQTVNYSGIENLAVFTKTGKNAVDTVNVTGTSASTTINAGSNNDVFNVLAISNDTTINLGNGNNRVNVGTLAPTVTGGTLNNIRGLLTVTGASSGTNTLYLDDSADNSAATATLSATSLTGVFGSGGALNYSGIATFNLYLGNGSHTVNVQGLNGVVNITLGNGVNTINLGSNAGAIVTDPVTGNAANTGSVLDQLLGTLNFTGTGANTVNVDDTGSSKPLTGALKPGSLQFLNLFTVNFPNVVAFNLALSQGNDLFAVQDTFTSASTTPVIILDGNGGDDTFVIIDTHAVMTVNGGDGGDSFYNLGNSSVLNLNGNAGDDSFYIYASVVENTSNVNAGSASSAGNKIYSYRQNAAVNIDGGTGNDKLFIFGTVLNDVIYINGTHIVGAGVNVTFTNIEQLTIAGLGGDDTFYIQSIVIPTLLIGDGSIVPIPSLAVLGITLPDLTGGVTPTSFNDTFYVGWQGASYIPGSLAGILAPLTIQGDNGPNLDGTTTNLLGTTDTIYVDDSGDTANQTYLLTSSRLTSSAMGPNGLLNYDAAVEDLNISAGAGADTLTINGTGVGEQTSIYGGRGNDAFVVNDANGGALLSPLAIFGDANTFAGDTLTVNGAGAGNTYDVTGFTIDGAGATISYETIEKLTINAGGATTFTVNGDSVPTFLNGSASADTFYINSNVVALTLSGNAGDDLFVINANSGLLTATGGTGNDSFTVNANSGTLTLGGGADNDTFTINGNSGALTANGDAGADTFTVNALSAAAALNGGAGNDSFTANAPLAAPLAVNGGGDAGDLLTVNGTGGSDYLIITGTTVNGAGATITYTATNNLVVNGVAGDDTFLILSDSVNTTVNGGSGNDLFYIRTTNGATTVNTGGGLNTVAIGSNVPYLNSSILNGIQGAVTVNGNTHDTLNIDDTASTTGKTGTLTLSTLNGLGMGAGGITYNGIQALNLWLGSGSDTLNIRSTHLGTVTVVNTGAGTNLINVGSLAPSGGGLVDYIQGPLTLVGSGNDTLNVDDTGSQGAKTGTLTPTALTGLGMGASGIVYSGLASLNIALGQGGDTFLIVNTPAAVTRLNGNGGNDTFNIQATTGSLYLNGGGGGNTFNFGSLAPATGGTLNNLAGAVYIIGETSGLRLIGFALGGTTTVNFDDSGDASSNTGTLTSSTLTGLGMTAGVTFVAVDVMNINLGAGNDTFNVQSTSLTTVTTLATGAGANVINVGSLAPLVGGVVNGVSGALILVGSGSDTLNVDDTGSTVAKTGLLTSTTLTGLGMGMAGITYSGLSTLNIKLGSGNDTFNVQSTYLTTVTTLNTGAGVNVTNVGSLASLVSGIQGALIVIGNGNDTLNVDDTGSTTAKTGLLTSTTLTGLGMGAAGITYSGLSILNINLGSGNDTFNVQSTNATTVTTLNTGAGVNTTNVGSLASLVSGIQGALIVIGNGNDTLNVDDSGDLLSQTGILTATTLTGLGLGTPGITYAHLSTLNITLGSASDTFTITGVTNATVTTVDGGPGTNKAILNFSGNYAGINLTLLNFATATLYVGGDFSGLLNDLGAITTVTIVGSLTATGVLNAGSIGAMTVGVDLAGLVTVVGLFDTLTVHGGTPGKIVAGDVHVITVFAGYGNKVLQVIEGGVERQIQATPVSGGTLPGTIHFAFVYDSLTTADPQLAIRITDTNPVARTFNLALVVVNSATAKFNLSRVDSLLNGKTGVSNVSLQGDLLMVLSAPELLFFTDSTVASRGGVMLAADSITGVEISGKFPIGFINVAGIEGMAFGIITTAAGAPVTVTSPLGSGGVQVLWNLLGSNATINAATDAFVVPFSETQSVRLFVHDNTNQTLDQILTLTDQSNDNLSIIAYVQVVPTTNNSINPLIQSVTLAGNGGSLNSLLSIANLTSTGPLGDVTISGGAGTTVNNAPGLGNVTAPSIFGSINVTSAGIYGVIQTTSGDLGQVTLTSGAISSVTTIFANGAITGQIISRGNLISTVKTNGAFTGVLAVHGDLGTIQRDGSGNAVTTAGALARFGGITIGGADSGQVIVLGNLYGNVAISGTMTGRLAVGGQAVAGLAATRYGILGNVTVGTFAVGGAIISGGLAGDLTGSTTLSLGAAKGFVAAEGAANLSASTTIAAASLIQNVHSGSNWAAISAIFTNGGFPLDFDTGGSLHGLGLIEADLANIQDAGGVLSGTIS